MILPSIVRRADARDEAEIWRLFRLAHLENGLFHLSEPKVQFYLDRVLHPEMFPEKDMGPRGIIGVIGPHGALQAMIMLILGSVWYSDEITMDDALSFVDPKCRQSLHAKALIKFAKHIVDGIREAHSDFRMTLGVVSTIRTAAKIRLYSQQLMPVGVFFAYPTPTELVPIGKMNDMLEMLRIRGG